MGHLGFSYTGAVYLVMLFVPRTGRLGTVLKVRAGLCRRWNGWVR